jgi:hypothetical protein
MLGDSYCAAFQSSFGCFEPSKSSISETKADKSLKEAAKHGISLGARMKPISAGLRRYAPELLPLSPQTSRRRSSHENVRRAQ